MLSISGITFTAESVRLSVSGMIVEECNSEISRQASHPARVGGVKDSISKMSAFKARKETQLCVFSFSGEGLRAA